MNPRPPRQTSDAEFAAFQAICDRLAGFDAELSFERVDGMLGALAAAPRRALPGEWLPLLFEGTFERVFADPDDHTRALRVLLARLSVLHDQLDAEALFDDPDALRLDPLVAVWSEDERLRFIEEEGLDEDAAAALLQIGREWARGFLDAVAALPGLWPPPPDEEAAMLFAQAFEHIAALLLPADSDGLRAHIAKHDARAPRGAATDAGPALPGREDLLVEATAAVQDLRMLWVDFAPRPPVRRVEAAPGRNDPCPCGSGRKYKKCHGAAAPAA